MKKLIALILVLACTLAIADSFAEVHELYSAVMKVVELDFDEDVVYVENWAGHVYSFYGVEDWYVGDYCSMVMDNNYTSDITDDTILSVRYERIDLLMKR